MTLEHSENRPIFSGSFWARIFRNRIVCRLWEINENGQDKFIAKKKVRYGKPFFYWKKNRYNIDYKAIRHGEKYFEFDCDVNNSVGALTWHSDTSQSITPNQAGAMLKQGLIDFFIERGGYPVWYLLVAIIMMGVIGGTLGTLLIDYIPYKEQYTLLEPKYNQLVQDYSNLQKQVAEANIE